MATMRDFVREPGVLVPKAPQLAVARTILEQLGGRQFIAMTGAKDFLGGPNTLSFKIPKTRRIRGVRITLDASDTYTMEFYTWGRNTRPKRPTRLAGGNYGTIDTLATHEGVYGDQLQAVFTEATGLRTSLTR